MPHLFVEHVGARIVESHSGSSLLMLTMQPHHRNLHGVAHGAVLFTLADTGMGVALYPTLAPHEACSTIEVKIAYFRPVPGGEVECRSSLVYRGRTTASLESSLTVDGVLVSRATGTFAIHVRRAAPEG